MEPRGRRRVYLRASGADVPDGAELAKEIEELFGSDVEAGVALARGQEDWEEDHVPQILDEESSAERW